MSGNLVLHRTGEYSWVTYIKNQIKKNLNFICLYQGGPGAGKTWSGISMAHLIDNEFSIKQVVFEPKSLMTVINSDEFKKKKWKILIFDEPQTTISNRSWQSATNRFMNYLLTTFRHQNIILIFCSPYVDFLDSQSRKLLHCIFECKNIDRKRNVCVVKGKLQQYNSYNKKTYQHRLHVVHKGRPHPLPVEHWMIPKPPKHLIIEYEKAKKEFTDNLNKEILDKFEELDEKAKSKGRKKKEAEQKLNAKDQFMRDSLDKRRKLTEKQKIVMVALAKMPAKEAVYETDLSLHAVYLHRRAAEKKGYCVEEFKHEVKI